MLEGDQKSVSQHSDHAMDMREWDEALHDPQLDHAELAARVGVDPDDHRRAAYVRELLVATCPETKPASDLTLDDADLTLEELDAAQICGTDMSAYLRVANALFGRSGDSA